MEEKGKKGISIIGALLGILVWFIAGLVSASTGLRKK
jgi:hypothetical protein